MLLLYSFICSRFYLNVVCAKESKEEDIKEKWHTKQDKKKGKFVRKGSKFLANSPIP